MAPNTTNLLINQCYVTIHIIYVMAKIVTLHIKNGSYFKNVLNNSILAMK